jgi:hypothetical protein
VHSIRSQVVTDADGQPDCLVLIITDVTEQYEAEARFESAFNANPAPAAKARAISWTISRVRRSSSIPPSGSSSGFGFTGGKMPIRQRC